MPAAKPPLAAMGSPDDAEARFYEALRLGDIDKLMAVWSDDDEIVCVHPGGQRLVGAGAIRAAFEAMFGHGAINAQPRNVHRLQTLASAVHSVVEQVQVMMQDGPRSAWVIATNVYHRTGEGWRMVAHHASPGTQAEPAEAGQAPSVLH